MFTKLLIANRGEISCRIIKTAKRMGILTVALYSDADQHALHVKMADEAIHVGPSPSKDSYLQAEKIIQIALKVGADAIHPGYGFLSENAAFANLCEQNNIVFVGPPVSAIEAMGSKSAAKNIMELAKVPLVPGYHGDDQSVDGLKSHADKMGYPVLLKAAAGGGGKGMRQVWKSSEFNDALAAAKREAMSSFNDDLMLVEKYLTEPRHVEIQVFCDNFGDGVYLFERDCSVQRRHQKIIEEAPAFGMTQALRAQMGEAALKAAKAIHYAGAGTVEFLLDSDGQFYFMEMNTRLQVEHPVTEMITGQDLVEWQLRVANNEPLPLAQDALKINGHAFEARIYAEDPNNDFLPATGRLSLLQPPIESRHVRVDTGVVQGDEVSVFYDPMIAKLIVWDENRDMALARLTKALTEYHIDGVVTNIEFLYNLANSAPFKAEQIDTGFIEKNQDLLLLNDKQDIKDLLPIAALYLMLSSQQNSASNVQDQYSPWSLSNAWRANEQHLQNLELVVGDNAFCVQVSQTGVGSHSVFDIKVNQQAYQCSGVIEKNQLTSTINGHKTLANVNAHQDGHSVFCNGKVIRFKSIQADLGDTQDNNADAGFIAPMNGTVVAILVELGQQVALGQTLMVMEAMKMEHSLKAPAAGCVKEFYFKAGELVDGGAELLNFQAAEVLQTNKESSENVT
ncbi:acetyl/propionyl/methylcrotonyl-CoA carboxylase subunit alpha [Paraglaciecola sp. MB-3u-78]|uniref:acetyl/propionyl/methylcrotonyl-CoA carboxylase subunit alpha n=1 Tax=Paraglaciecola sp. MB-3u-78 TaxID=2058332 RepID=UPI000C327FE8|nr:acetyl/propionyl/methylcrotonyl-CoA carboxylase subunit alpha [Paraglaciecola sp. MB-3u-78]PKG96014.1 3-methylcrotonyl-CoA carboxylase [Paraglaciecola sp. MB-3u-78]